MGRDRDGVAGVHAHGVNILYATDNDTVVLAITNDFKFILLPTKHRFIDLYLIDARGRDAAANQVFKLLAVVRDTTATATKRKCRTNNGGQTNDIEVREASVECRHHFASWQAVPARLDNLAELQSILGSLNDFAGGTDHLDVVLLQHAEFVKFACAVQRGLPTERWQHRVNRCTTILLKSKNAFDGIDRDGFDVGAIREHWIGHDRGRVGVDQHDTVALVAQRLARLRARVVEFTALADDDRAGAENQDGVYVIAAGHG